jgi:hypothetical protein
MKFEKWLEETTTTAGIAQPLAQGSVDVIGGGCPEGYKYDKEKKICVPEVEEAVALTDPDKLTAEWKRKAKENTEVAHWMMIAKLYKKAGLKCQEKFRAHLKKMNMSKAEIE